MDRGRVFLYIFEFYWYRSPIGRRQQFQKLYSGGSNPLGTTTFMDGWQSLFYCTYLENRRSLKSFRGLESLTILHFMQKIKLKYPLKIGNVLVPKNTEGYVLNDITKRMMESFPNISFNDESNQLLIQLDYQNIQEIIVDKTQVIMI